jgi:chromosome segregation ATPase
LEKELYGT